MGSSNQLIPHTASRAMAVCYPPLQRPWALEIFPDPAPPWCLDHAAFQIRKLSRERTEPSVQVIVLVTYYQQIELTLNSARANPFPRQALGPSENVSKWRWPWIS